MTVGQKSRPGISEEDCTVTATVGLYHQSGTTSLATRVVVRGTPVVFDHGRVPALAAVRTA